MVVPLCGPDKATGTKVGLGSTACASVGGKDVAVTTITTGVDELHADNKNVNIKPNTNIT